MDSTPHFTRAPCWNVSVIWTFTDGFPALSSSSRSRRKVMSETPRSAAACVTETAPVLRQLAALVESGDLTIPVGRRYPLAAAAEAQAASETGHGRGRIVLEM